nr:HAMP domain-containing histidine kinase [Oscillospiraceae bacterium]
YLDLQADSVALPEINRYEYQIRVDEYGSMSMERVPTYEKIFAEKKSQCIYFIISNAQMILIPLWVIACVALTGIIFYRLELKKPIGILLDASSKISENQLDFEIIYKKQNELGQLCKAFNDMRQALDENNREMWHSLEERKRLNSAFSHDLRTPLTVLRGYTDFLQNYIGQVSEEKIQNILSMMGSQINRLENYTYKMSALQKLEDIVPDVKEISTDRLKENVQASAIYLCQDKSFSLHFDAKMCSVFLDAELVSEVYENLLSNAVRYTKNKILIDISVTEEFFMLSVENDGNGFTQEALQLATEPFYRGDGEQNSSHFGLGLYICRIICEKCGGTLQIGNTAMGAKVTAKFFCKSR